MSGPARDADSLVSVIDKGVAIASLALYCYEWMITFDREIDRIWRRKWTLSTWVFVVTRYAGLLDVILQQLPAMNLTACLFEIRLTHSLVLLQYFTSALFTGLRTYALCNRHPLVLFVVFALGGIPVITNTMTFVQTHAHFASGVCRSVRPFTDNQELYLSLAARVAAIVADGIALLVTWKNTISNVREASCLRINVPLGKALARDGTLLFLGLLAINVLQLASDNISDLPNLVGQFGCAVSSTYPSILLCRFILNLRAAVDQPRNGSAATSAKSFSLFNSDMLIGNLGESLELEDESDAQHASENIGVSETICDSEHATAKTV